MFIKYFFKIVLFVSQDLFKVAFSCAPSSFFKRRRRMKLGVIGEGEIERCRRRRWMKLSAGWRMRGMKLSAVGEGTKSNKHVSYPPPPPHTHTHPQFSSPIPRLLGWPTGGGRIGVRRRGDHAPTPQAGKVTDSHGGGGVRMGGWGLGLRGGSTSTKPPTLLGAGDVKLQ